MRAIEYVNVLRPSIEYLQSCGKLLLDSRDMAQFLGIPWKAMQQLAYTDRVLGPLQLGFGKCYRWSILEVLDWVRAGCPRRMEWIKLRTAVGRYRRWR